MRLEGKWMVLLHPGISKNIVQHHKACIALFHLRKCIHFFVKYIFQLLWCNDFFFFLAVDHYIIPLLHSNPIDIDQILTCISCQLRHFSKCNAILTHCDKSISWAFIVQSRLSVECSLLL